MPLVAGTVIDEARDLHPSFDTQTHPDKICLRFLSRWQAEVLGRALIVYPTLFDDAVTVVPLPLASFDAGYTLTEPLALSDVVVLIGSYEYPVTLIPYESRFDPQPLYAGWVINRTLYLSGEESKWTGATELRLRYTTQPADLTALADTLVIPDAAKTAAVTAIAAFMAGRGISRTEGVEANAKYFQTQAEQAEAKWLESLWLLDSATVHTIRDVM